MNTKQYVLDEANRMIAEGKSKSEVIWQAARNCVGWPYVYAATGQDCTPANRRNRYNAHPDHPTIKSSCQNFDGNSTCVGCKWLPHGERVRQSDCQGFIKFIAGYVGITFTGGGCTSMWNDDSNWEAKGTIDTIPEDQLVCVFTHDSKTGKKSHIGWSWHGETVECSVGVQYFAKRNKKWTHWAKPRGLDGVAPAPETRPTLRKGSSGEYVHELQNDLLQLGYDIGASGADGKFGNATQKAVKDFQTASGLVADGIVGRNTWAALDATCTVPAVLYRVTIPHLTEHQVNALKGQYPDIECVAEE